jgi:predicted HAD superfamily Cof-like phosphohydrolase
MGCTSQRDLIKENDMFNFKDAIERFAKMYKLERPEKPQMYTGSRQATGARLRQFKKILQDELLEVDQILVAVDDTACADEQVLTMIADWLGDVQVYCASEMRKYGLDNDMVLDIIMQSNFSKLGADGEPIMRDGKVQKGPNYWKPEPKLLEYITKAQHDKIVSKANDKQIGGAHYKVPGLLEHWDLVLLYEWDYFQGQITKYLMRWKIKHATPEKRLEDLKKSAHFLEKYIEAEQKKLVTDVPTPVVPAKLEALLSHPPVLDITRVNQDGNGFWQNEGYYGDGTCLYSCRRCKSTTRQSFAPGAPHQPCRQHFPAPSEVAHHPV